MHRGIKVQRGLEGTQQYITSRRAAAARAAARGSRRGGGGGGAAQRSPPSRSAPKGCPSADPGDPRLTNSGRALGSARCLKSGILGDNSAL